MRLPLCRTLTPKIPMAVLPPMVLARQCKCLSTGVGSGTGGSSNADHVNAGPVKMQCTARSDVAGWRTCSLLSNALDG